ncbi:L-fucose isomerase 2 domain protein [Candidatus Vecturithrix granuli]|uniref:L-fucose isomerase 2 domain protein n=1 Tax=Vecturithrix granuli TaxID=1499967 RepID=A0A081BUU9_VECG1|nr:L-fucose isomerase 2 domain protein [Candidatus Vecturithrix granuli]
MLNNTMITLRVKLLAYRNAPEELYQQGTEKFTQLLERQYVEFVDQQPDVLFFLSGGSERAAADMLEPNRFYTLIAFHEGNSYAAATEVKAYYNQHGARSVLLDYDSRGTRFFVKNLYQSLKGIKRLRGQRLGLIGDVSDWLIASKIEAPLLQERLGIELRKIPWSQLPSYQEQRPAEDFLRAFQTEYSSNLEATAKVYALFKACIDREQLDAITVECFSLVTEHAVTACLPLGKFNADGVPAGCEGDIVSIVGMMLAKEVTGVIPWMANTVKIFGDMGLFAHCTISPGLLTDYTISTHFETGKGTAIQGYFREEEVTVLRLNNTLDKAFIAPGKVLRRPKYDSACRTQLEVKLPPSAVQALRENPLGNHHLILPHDHTEVLSLACQVLGMELQ